MENIIDAPLGAGALPQKREEREEREEPPALNEPENPQSGEISYPTESTDKPRVHVRSPELRRNSTRLTMAAAAVIGAGAGVRLILADGAANAADLAQTLSGSFGEVFLRQTVLSAMFLLAEFILGFFAAGDLIVWTAPFFFASGAVLRLSAGSPKLIPGLLICLAAVTFGAAISADMSGMLWRLTKGGTIYLDDRPRRAYAISFLGCLAASAAGALLVAGLIVVSS